MMYRIVLVYLTALLVLPYVSKGQSAADSLAQQYKWYVPDAAVVQYAGNMGMVTVGAGYDLAKEKIALDVLYGYVPKFQASEAGHMLTLKSTYKPFKLAVKEGYSVIPIQVGLGLSYHFGEKYTLYWQEPFPEGYYWWSPSVRVLGFAGASVNKTFTGKAVKDIGLYAELGTYELLVTSWFKDDKLSLWDIASASVGVRVRF